MQLIKSNPPPVPKPPLYNFTVNDEIVDVNLSAMAYIKKNYAREIKWGIAFSIVFEVVILYFLINQLKQGTLDDPRTAFLLLLPFIIYSLLLVSVKKKLRHQFYEKFASINGYKYSKTGWLTHKTGAIFQVGENHKMEDIIQGQIGNFSFSLFNYFYTIGQGKNSRAYQSTVWEINFQTIVPPILLLVDKHYFGDDISDNNLSSLSKIDLGGELEKHFNLFAEKKFEIEALQIFSSDFLQEIYQNYKNFSFDFVGTSLFIYANRIIQNKAELLQMKTLANMVVERLAKSLPAMRGSILSLHEALTKSEPQNNLDNITGQITRTWASPENKKILLIFLIIFFLLVIIPYLLDKL